MNEETLIKTMDLPSGRDWEWFPDVNLVVLSPRLCPAQREMALNEVQAHWRRSCIRVLPSGASEPEAGLSTVPLAYMPQARG